MKIPEAGILYANILFIYPGQKCGGVSGGVIEVPDWVDEYYHNKEFCHIYFNSRLFIGYNQEVVYKCFMDSCPNWFFHDIMEDHFECGFWIADYNGEEITPSDGVKIINCRIINNFTDGVNFTKGINNPTVYKFNKK